MVTWYTCILLPKQQTLLPTPETEMADARITNLVAQWRKGDRQAGAELVKRYADRLVALVKSRLPAKLGKRLDPEDVVHSAYRSFFSAAIDGRYDRTHGGDIWQLLVTITLHKLYRQMERHSAQKRSLEKEQTYGSEDSLHALPSRATAAKPSPLEVVALCEELEEVQRQLKPPQRAILELRLQGRKVDEIARQMGCTERTVWRVLERIKQQLEQRLGPVP